MKAKMNFMNKEVIFELKGNKVQLTPKPQKLGLSKDFLKHAAPLPGYPFFGIRLDEGVEAPNDDVLDYFINKLNALLHRDGVILDANFTLV